MLLRGINHVTLKVRDLEVSERFYCGVLGMQRVGERRKMRFYAAGAHHHDLALMEVGARAGSPRVEETGLAHLCFDVADERALTLLYERCLAAGLAVSTGVDHTITHGFYVLDPDGHDVELAVDVPREQWARTPAPFALDRPYALGKKNPER